MKKLLVLPTYCLSVGPLALGLFLISNVGTSLASAQTTLLLGSSSWNTATDGDLLSSPWGQQFGGGTSPAPSTVRIASYSGENWAFINNAATDETGDNPRLQGNFTSFTSLASTLSISFDYVIPQNYGNNSQIQFALNQYIGGVSTTAIRIGLGRNYDRNGIYYVDDSNARQLVGHTFTAGERVTITLSNISLAAHTYDLAWSSSTGASNSLTGLSFTNTGVDQLTYITFGENAGVISTSQIYINNVSVVEVSSIPEPANTVILSLIMVGGAAFTWRRRR